MMMRAYIITLVAAIAGTFVTTHAQAARERLVPIAPAPMLQTGQDFDPVLAQWLIQRLQKGGYIVYFRHFETGKDTPDYINATLGQCGTQRQLNADGARQAVQVRNSFQALRIPVSKVLASPFCRAWQSADLAFGGHKTVKGLALPKSPTETFSKKLAAQMAATVAPLLKQRPKVGTNTVIVAHDGNMTAIGAPDPKTQGEAFLFAPKGKRFALIMQIKPDVWPMLASQVGAKS
jgi:phosphohistidine phosphatase SixA